MLEALLEASRHLLVPEMADNKALNVAKEIAGSLLQVGSRYLASWCKPSGFWKHRTLVANELKESNRPTASLVIYISSYPVRP